MSHQNIIEVRNHIPQQIADRIISLINSFPIDIEVLETKHHDQDPEKKYLPAFTAGQRTQINGFDLFNGNVTYWVDQQAYEPHELPSFRII